MRFEPEERVEEQAWGYFLGAYLRENALSVRARMKAKGGEGWRLADATILGSEDKGQGEFRFEASITLGRNEAGGLDLTVKGTVEVDETGLWGNATIDDLHIADADWLSAPQSANSDTDVGVDDPDLGAFDEDEDDLYDDDEDFYDDADGDLDLLGEDESDQLGEGE